ncbi:MAG TPA: TlyA family RNA methyltransferase [Syntrophomonadaceae bacterium]|nr:TlyA family RNA methyltransferase [Syntrophomonadaceae bacterium]HQE23757.1 TlyA family RNA methyltransferase [Syntrophomonadaceae bacterium]
MTKIRLDTLVYRQGLAPSREKARAMVLAGQIRVNDHIIDKPGTAVDESAVIEVTAPGCPYVSRGGLKLEKALDLFGVQVQDLVVLDVGASTGGFTDCVLQRGTRRVYAVDVGYGQLDWKLRNDPRVVNIERTNIRYLPDGKIPELVDLVTVDVSFISTSFVFPVIKALLKHEGAVICLIKPQFEAGRDKVGRKGVVRDKSTHREVLLNSIANAASHGLYCRDMTYSPITGPEGNIEFLIYLRQDQLPLPDIDGKVEDVVDEAHQHLGGKHN